MKSVLLMFPFTDYHADLSIEMLLLFFERILLGEYGESRNAWTVEDLVDFNDDLVFSLINIEPTTSEAVFQRA